MGDKQDTAPNPMFKKALIVAASTAALSAPAFAGSIGTLTGTSSTIITSGSRTLTVNGGYASEEHTVGSSTTGTGATARADWDPTVGPVLVTAGTGGTAANSASATYDTNAVTGGTYVDSQIHSYTGNDTSASTGVFFNY